MSNHRKCPDIFLDIFNSIPEFVVFSSLQKLGNAGSERSSNLPNVTSLVSGETGSSPGQREPGGGSSLAPEMRIPGTGALGNCPPRPHTLARGQLFLTLCSAAHLFACNSQPRTPAALRGSTLSHCVRSLCENGCDLPGKTHLRP